MQRLVEAARRALDEAGGVSSVVIAPVPSTTWPARDRVAHGLADGLGGAMIDGLAWEEAPPDRQGTLLNNDQRRQNVSQRMTWVGPPPPLGATVIVLDDYVGSGATMREAARVLKKGVKITGLVIPVAVARIKWRLGRPGIV